MTEAMETAVVIKQEMDSDLEAILHGNETEYDECDPSEFPFNNLLMVPTVESSENEDTDEEGGEMIDEDEWATNIRPPEQWGFEMQSGINPEVLLQCQEPNDFYLLFLNDEILKLVAEHTNNHGKTKKKDWKNVDENELKKFIGLCLQMSIVQLPSLRDYWSTRPVFGGCAIGSKIMPRTRFEDICTYLNFQMDDDVSSVDGLFKMQTFIDMFNNVCKQLYIPEETVCIEKSIVRGRLSLNPNDSKSSTFGVKVVRLYSKSGYTYNTLVYAGKTKKKAETFAETTVLKIMDGLLDQNRCLVADNSFTSIRVAQKLLQRKTHLIGTMKDIRRRLPGYFAQIIPKGMVSAQQNKDGILILKWHDKKDYLMLSTKHDDSKTSDGTPIVVEEYKQARQFIDANNQMSTYTPFIRRTTTLYQKIFFHMITQTALINSWRLYNDNVNHIRFMDFKMTVVEHLLDQRFHTITTNHILEELAGPKSASRRRCVGCYKYLSKESGSRFADRHARRINTRCSSCHKYFCLFCFQSLHKIC